MKLLQEQPQSTTNEAGHGIDERYKRQVIPEEAPAVGDDTVHSALDVEVVSCWRPLCAISIWPWNDATSYFLTTLQIVELCRYRLLHGAMLFD